MIRQERKAIFSARKCKLNWTLDQILVWYCVALFCALTLGQYWMKFHLFAIECSWQEQKFCYILQDCAYFLCNSCCDRKTFVLIFWCLFCCLKVQTPAFMMFDSSLAGVSQVETNRHYFPSNIQIEFTMKLKYLSISSLEESYLNPWHNPQNTDMFAEYIHHDSCPL